MPAWKAASISANASSSVSPWPKKSGAEPIPPKFPQPSAIRATASPGSSPCISLAASRSTGITLAGPPEAVQRPGRLSRAGGGRCGRCGRGSAGRGDRGHHLVDRLAHGLGRPVTLGDLRGPGPELPPGQLVDPGVDDLVLALERV